VTARPAWLADVAGLGATPLGGLIDGAVGAALATVPRAWTVVAEPDDADTLARSLRWHGRRALVYPADDVRPWSGASPSPGLVRARLAARLAWDRGEDVHVVAPAAAMLLRVPALDARDLRVGAACDRGDLAAWLVATGWVAAPRVDEPGCFALRGGVLEVWPHAASGPARVEWFDDEIDRIVLLDPDSGSRSVGTLTLLPVREVRLDAASTARAAERLHARAVASGTGGAMLAARARLLEDLRARVPFPGVEDHLPLLDDVDLPRPAGGARFVVEPDLVRAELARAERIWRDRWAASSEPDRPPVHPEERYGTAAEAHLHGATPVSRLLDPEGVDLRSEPVGEVRVKGGELAPLVRRIRAWMDEGRAVTLAVEGPSRAEHLRALLVTHGIHPGDAPAGSGVRAPPAPGEVVLALGPELPQAYVLPDRVVLTAEAIFGTRPVTPPGGGGTRFRKAAAVSFASVKPGDPIVHRRYGVGAYVGLERLSADAGVDVEGDFVVLRYQGDARLYVPVTGLDALSPWRAVGEDAAPRLDKLGGNAFELRRAKVRDAVVAMAHELLRLHARRKVVPAQPYPGGAYTQSFAAGFPHVETPDQEAAIAEVLRDVAGDVPMDRLVVGDVGFGKTEVALRAAMAVVEGGGQVAFMCPTALLANQHLATFRERFAEFPVRVELLSGAGAGRALLADVASGAVDVVIGTTKLLGRGVRFRQLGLVVVDEEHRFGVKQKEDLKRFAAGAHYLAMSATPIPRTLHTALAGLRSISVLATPPLGRHPIRTEVVRHDKARIAEELRLELARGGQAYFVHNRVQSLEGVARWLRALVPEARVGVIHGQMDAAAQERAMVAFVRRETDVLVCTTVVENGIDVANANAMIVNRADTLGLSQLYQLRGRIGRSDRKARCTLLVAGGAAMRRQALDRLHALTVHGELGANFALASADLELRGGGELLGEKQHGHIAAIGFDAYLELLEEAVAQVRGSTEAAQPDPEVEVPVPALLPEAYVPATAERLAWYQQLAGARTRAEVDRVSAQLEARHGALPPEAAALVSVAALRVVCRDLGVARLALLKVRVVAELAPQHRLDPTRLLALLSREPARFRRTGEMGVEVRVNPDEAREPFRVLEYALGRLSEAVAPR
jgi:transcription-repair coupling factor (superfamily II helicase)